MFAICSCRIRLFSHDQITAEYYRIDGFSLSALLKRRVSSVTCECRSSTRSWPKHLRISPLIRINSTLRPNESILLHQKAFISSLILVELAKMTTITTPLTKLFKIKHPIFLAGMNVAAGPGLAAAVTNAGGLGTFVKHTVANSRCYWWCWIVFPFVPHALTD